MEDRCEKTEKRIGYAMVFFFIVFLFIASKCTAQTTQREKYGDYWYSYSQVVRVNYFDTLELFAAYHFTPYNFHSFGVKLRAADKTIGLATMIICYKNGLKDYIGAIFQDAPNKEGFAYFYLNEAEKNHIRQMDMDRIEILNPMQNKTYSIPMDYGYTLNWYRNLLKQ